MPKQEKRVTVAPKKEKRVAVIPKQEKRLSPEEIGSLVRAGLPDSIAAGARVTNRGQAGRARSKTPTLDRVLSAGEPAKNPDVTRRVEESFLSGAMRKLKEAGQKIMGKGRPTPAEPSGPRAAPADTAQNGAMPRYKGGGMGLSNPATKKAYESLESEGAFGPKKPTSQMDSLRAEGRKIRKGGQ